jgi:hypothetical protein
MFCIDTLDVCFYFSFWTGICLESLERMELAMPLLGAMHCGLILFVPLLYFQMHREAFYGFIAMTHDFSSLEPSLPAINELI